MTDREPDRPQNSRTDADAWFSPKRFALLLGGLIALTFPRVIAGRETFFFRDFGVFTYPVAYFQRQCFWRGEMPLWDPYNFCGLPFLAQWNTVTLYPPDLFYLIFPLSWALGVLNLMHLFWAGLGMYFLVRHWTGNQFAAAVAGVLFAYNGLTWHCLMWLNAMVALGWMPWVVLCVSKAWREGGRHIVTAALAGAMQMLAGTPEITLLTWALLGALWLAETFQRNASVKAMVLRLGIVVLLVTGLTAAQLLPFLELLKNSHRDAGFGASGGWAMPLSGLANFLAPLFKCYPSSQGIFVQYDQYWVASYYVGVGAMMLAAAALWRTSDRRIWLLVAVVAVSVLMALGNTGDLYPFVMRLLPVLGFMRYPIKFVVLAVFLIPLLAGIGLSRWEHEQGKTALPKKYFICAGLIVLALLGLFIWLESQYPGVRDDWNVTLRNTVVRGVFVVLMIVVLMSLRFSRSPKFDLGVRLLLLLLLWMDVLTHTPNLTPTVARSVYEPGTLRAYFKLNEHPAVGEPRFMETERDMDRLHFTSITNAESDYLCRRVALFDNCNLLDDLPKTDGFYSLYLKNTIQALSLVYASDTKNVDLASMKDFLCIGHISASAEGNDQTLDWKPRPTALPFVTAGQKPVFANETNTLVGLLDPKFDSREVVYLPAEAEAVIKPQHSGAKIITQDLGTQKLKFEVESSGPAMVVIAQSWYPEWRAYVDDKPTTLWRANHGFQALETPAGRHKVIVVYEDARFRAGAIISLASLVIVTIMWFWTGQKKKRLLQYKLEINQPLDSHCPTPSAKIPA